MFRLKIAALAAVALSVAACHSTTTGVAPSVPGEVFTDVFDGTLTTNGATTFPFNVSSSGTVYATLVSVADPSIVIGLSLGTWNGASCTIVLANDQATQGAVLAGASTGVGRLCARVYDVGKVVDPLDYEISVVHP
jgi:hypothetical protein